MMNLVGYALSVIFQMLKSWRRWIPLCKKRVSTSSPDDLNALVQHRSPESQRLSIAQLCNEDVLDEIFFWPYPGTRSATLASAALVCKNWLPSARRRLYHRVLVDNLGPPRLYETLSTEPVLRSLIRRLKLKNAGFGELQVSRFDWLALLPERSVQSVEFGILMTPPKNTSPPTLSLLDIPAIQTTPRLIINCRMFLTPERLCEVFGMPYLENLSITIPDETTHLNCSFTSFPNLRKLTIYTDKYALLIEGILRGLPSPLQRFDLYAKKLDDADILSLRKGLERHAPHLQRLSLFGDPFSQLCFMDDYILSFPSLESFLCGYQIHTPQIISRLPPTLSSLAFAISREWDEPIPAAEYTAAFRQHRDRLLRLRRLDIIDYALPSQKWELLMEMCMMEGIAFAKWDETQYCNAPRGLYFYELGYL